MKFILVFLSLYIPISNAKEYKYYTTYSLVNNNTSTSNSTASDFTNSADTGLSITSGRITKEKNHFEIEFTYLGDMGFKYAEYLTYKRYVLLTGLNMIKRWEYISFGPGFGIMRIDNHLKESDEAAISITENLRTGVGYYVYFKALIELHYQYKMVELFGSLKNYYWLQQDGEVEIDDNGQSDSKDLSTLQSVNSFNIGLRYYFD